MKRANFVRSWLWLAVLIAGCSGHHGGSDSGFGSTSPPPPATVAKVIVNPSSLLLQPGGTAQISATALDANGATISGVSVNWSASTPAVSVDANGKVTAGGSVDSAVITATINSVSSAPVPALVASLNPGTQFISNDQVVSDPALVDTTQEPGVGSQLKMTLSGAAPAVGTVIVSSGDKSIIGQVVSTAANGANSDVVFQVMALADVFSELKLTQTYSKDELKQNFDVQPAQTIARTDGGREYVFDLDTTAATPSSVRRAAAVERAANARGKAARPAETVGSVKWSIGPFKCSATADLSNSLTFKNVQTHVVDKMGPVTVNISVSQGNFDVNVSSQGSMQLFVDGELHFSENLNGSASCDARLFEYLVPVPPVVALLFVPVVPVVGMRANVNGTLTVGDVVIGLKSQVEQPMTMGFSITRDGTFTNTSSLDGDATTQFDWTLNQSNAGDLVRFSGDAKAGLYVDVSFTNAVLGLYSLFKADYDPIKSLIDAFGGFHATLGIASVNAQVQDQTVPAGYALTLLTEIKPGEFISSFVSFLSSVLKIASIQLPDLKFEPTVFSQPQGTAHTSLRRFAAGDSVQFQVTLTPDSVDPSFLGAPIVPYNVKQVEIWRKTSPGQSEMVGMDVGVPGAAGGPGKNVFTVLWNADGAGSTANSLSATDAANFYAVVVPNFGEDFGFRVGPALGWLGVVQSGGPKNEEGRRVVVDPDGNLIIASISGDSLNTTPPLIVQGAYAVQILKIDPNSETVLWARSIDGPGDEEIWGMTVDGQGNIFLAGTAVNSPLTADNIGTQGFSGWAASFSKDGNQLWLTQWQDSYYNSAESIALGPNRELYVLGVDSAASGNVGGDIFSTACNDVESATHESAEDCGDITLRRLDPNTGVVLWTATDALAGWQIARGMTVDSAGNIYTAAQSGANTETQNTGVVSADGYAEFVGSYRETLANGNTTAHMGAAFTKWTSDGKVAWRSNVKLPHITDDSGNDVYSDENPQGIIASGAALWCMLVTTGGFADLAPNEGGSDSVLLGIDPDSGQATPFQVFATSGDDFLALFGPAPNGDLLVAGETSGSLFAPNAGGTDVVAMRLGPNGSIRWQVQFGGLGNDSGIGAAAGADGNVFVTGYTDGLMPASLSGLPPGVQLNQPAGGEDLFIAKLSAALGTIQSIHPTAP